MRSVNVAELKNRLSKYLTFAKGGEEITAGGKGTSSPQEVEYLHLDIAQSANRRVNWVNEPSWKFFVENTTRGGGIPDRSFDIEFWQEQGDRGHLHFWIKLASSMIWKENCESKRPLPMSDKWPA